MIQATIAESPGRSISTKKPASVNYARQPRDQKTYHASETGKPSGYFRT